MNLLEREHHLAQLGEHLREAIAGHGRVVMVGGEAGVGKTSLMQRFQATLGESVEVFRASCDALSTPAPLGPSRDLAPRLGITIGPDTDGNHGREALFRSILDAPSRRESPVVIIGEDAHWTDGASLELVRFLARRIGDVRLLFVITYRDDELGPTHPLRLVLGDLATTETVRRMQLPPLSVDAVQRLALGSGRDAARLHQLTGGNPFFVTEVLTANDGDVPATVADAVLARAARLPAEARSVLDLAAIIGGHVDPDLLLAVAGPVSDEIDRCIVGGLILVDRDRIRFRHELTRAAVLAAIPPLRRRLLHGRVLSALRERGECAVEAAILAHHAEAAGDQPAVLAFSVAAAEQATSLHAHREAAAQYARALRFADSLPDDERASLYEAHAVACYLSDRGEDAIESRLEAIDIRRRRGDRLRHGDNLRWLSRHYWFVGHGAEAETAGLDALRILEELPPGRELAMAYSNMAQLGMLAGDVDEAMSWGEQAQTLAEEVGDTETAIHALCNVGTARRQTDGARAQGELERSFHLADAGGFLDHAGRALTNLAWGEAEQMNLAVAEQRIGRGLAYTTEHDLDNYRVYLLAMRALVRSHSGAWDAGQIDIETVLQSPGLSPLARIFALTAKGRILACRGDAMALQSLDDALTLAEPTGHPLRLGPVHAARAEAALIAGDRERALAEVGAIHPLVLERGNAWLRGEFARLLWQAGDHTAPVDDLAPPYAMQIAGDWAAAAAAWQDLDCPYNAALAMIQSDDTAAIQRAVSTLELLEAQPALKLAIARLRELGMQDVPAIRRGPRRSTQAHPAGLTQREVEVLQLLITGLRNAEIADQLFLTPKTVSHHLSAIYAKLGVANRVEATRAVTQRGLLSGQSG